MQTLDELVTAFAENVLAQAEAIARCDPKAGNRFARKYVRAWDALRAQGDQGRDALAQLFGHESPDVRSMAAAFLLKHRTEEAKKVLLAVARGKGLAAFGASQALERWEEGDWHLDPD